MESDFPIIFFSPRSDRLQDLVAKTLMSFLFICFGWFFPCNFFIFLNAFLNHSNISLAIRSLFLCSTRPQKTLVFLKIFQFIVAIYFVPLFSYFAIFLLSFVAHEHFSSLTEARAHESKRHLCRRHRLFIIIFFIVDNKLLKFRSHKHTHFE